MYLSKQISTVQISDRFMILEILLEPIGPTNGKPKSGVDEAKSVTSETRGLRQPSSHFTKSSHNNVYVDSDKTICDEYGAWSSLCESFSTIIVS